MALTFYTVRTHLKGYPVVYLDPTDSQEKEFTGPFGDPGEASQEFQAHTGKEKCCYLQPGQFTRKVNAIRDMQAKMQTWNSTQQKGA